MMKEYVLHYSQKHKDGDVVDGLFFRCTADNYEHAVEQLNDSVNSEKSTVIFHEFYKGEQCN